MRRILSYLLNIGLLAIFAFISVYVPQNIYSFVILIYILVFLAVNFIIVGISAKKIFKDLVYVSEGETIFEETKKTVQLLRRKDKLLVQESKLELKSYVKNVVAVILMFLIIMLIVNVPLLRETIISVPREFFLTHLKDEKVSLFLSYMIFYLILMVVSMGFSRTLGKGGAMETVTIPSQYRVTKRGLVIDERLAYKFPLKVKRISRDASRKYVELVVSGTPAFGQSGVTSRIRLYTNRVEELYKILKSNVEIE